MYKILNVKEVLEMLKTKSELCGDTWGLILIKKVGDKYYYLNKFDCWSLFGDETKSEDPMCYKTKRGVRRFLASTWFNNDQQIALWIHPDAHDKPIDKYQLMTGKLFPGSARK